MKIDKEEIIFRLQIIGIYAAFAVVVFLMLAFTASLILPSSWFK